MIRLPTTLLPWGLRRRLATAFAVGALLVSALLAFGVWTLTSQIMMNQRVDLAERQGKLTASRLTPAIPEAGPGPETLELQDTPGTEWWVATASRTWTSGTGSYRQPPAGYASEGQQAQWLRIDGHRSVAVWTPVPDRRAVLLEITEATDLNSALRTLSLVLLGCSLASTLAGGVLGLVASRHVLQPLQDMGTVASDIGRGHDRARITPTTDPDLVPFVDSFNGMVDALEQRRERDRSFAADAAHELRSPLTTLVGAVDLLQRRREGMDERSRKALDLLSTELDRFHRMLEDLLQLGQLDAEASPRETIRMDRLVEEALETVPGTEDADRYLEHVVVSAHPAHLKRAVTNLVRNAEVHGGGLSHISVRQDEGWMELTVDDAGPGVEEVDRERIFERFHRGGSRGSKPGTGLGLSLVSKAVEDHGGTVRCTRSPQGGARFELRLPLVDN